MAIAHARRRPPRMIDHGHLHRLEPARDRLADAAHADQPDGAVAQRRLGQRIRLLRPFARAQEAFRLREFAHGAEQEAERGVGDFFGQHLRCVGHGDAVRRRPRYIDVVVADPERRKDFQSRKAPHEFAIDAHGGHRRGNPAHARADLGEKRLAILRLGELVHREAGFQPIDDDGLERPEQQHFGSFSGHQSLLICVPDAVQCEREAQWCTADPGSQQTLCLWRSWVCSATVRAALRP